MAQLASLSWDRQSVRARQGLSTEETRRISIGGFTFLRGLEPLESNADRQMGMKSCSCDRTGTAAPTSRARRETDMRPERRLLPETTRVPHSRPSLVSTRVHFGLEMLGPVVTDAERSIPGAIPVVVGPRPDGIVLRGRPTPRTSPRGNGGVARSVWAAASNGWAQTPTSVRQ